MSIARGEVAAGQGIFEPDARRLDVIGGQLLGALRITGDDGGEDFRVLPPDRCRRLRVEHDAAHDPAQMPPVWCRGRRQKRIAGAVIDEAVKCDVAPQAGIDSREKFELRSAA